MGRVPVVARTGVVGHTGPLRTQALAAYSDLGTGTGYWVVVAGMKDTMGWIPDPGLPAAAHRAEVDKRWHWDCSLTHAARVHRH